MQENHQASVVFVFYLRISVALTVSFILFLEVCPFPLLPYYTNSIQSLATFVNLFFTILFKSFCIRMQATDQASGA